MIELAIAGDAAFTKQVAVTLASLSRTTSEECRVFVLHDGFSVELRDRLAASTTDSVRLDWRRAPTAETRARCSRVDGRKQPCTGCASRSFSPQTSSA